MRPLALGIILLLLLSSDAHAQVDASVAYLGMGAESPTDFPTNRTFHVADASHILIVTGNTNGTGTVTFRIREPDGKILWERSMPQRVNREEPVRLAVGDHVVEIEPRQWTGTAELSISDATLAGWVGTGQQLAYEGGTLTEPRDLPVLRTFYVPSASRHLDFYHQANGTGRVEWRLRDAEGAVVFGRFAEGVAPRQDELWQPTAGVYTLEVQRFGFVGFQEASVVDNDPPPFPDPYADVPLLAASAKVSDARASWLPFAAGIAALALVALGGGGLALARRRKARPARPGRALAFEEKYKMLRELGSGAFGTTWLAQHLGLDRPVVIKRLKDERVGGLDDFLREARILAQIDHPCVTRVFDVEKEAGGAYIVMEYVDGGTLDERLAKAPMTRAEALRVVDDVLQALSAVHAKGIVHGDIKPSNILLTKDGRAKLADFGIARRAGAADLSSTMVVGSSTGTPLYMAPEQVRGEPASPSADLYAVGIVAYKMLAGGYYLQPEPHLETELRNAILSREPAIAQAGLPPQLASWLAKALAKDPARRWADAAAMRTGMS